MAKVEVDEAEYNRMLALQQVAGKIVNNPAARRRLEEAHKLVDPNAPTPTLDADRTHNEPLNALKTEMQAKLDAMQKERDDEKRDGTLRSIAQKQERDFARLKTEHHYTDEGVEAVRKLMEAKGLLDVDDGVAVFERAHPPQMPTTPGGGLTGSHWGFVDNNDASDENIKSLIATKGENDYLADRMAQQALADFRAGKR